VSLPQRVRLAVAAALLLPFVAAVSGCSSSDSLTRQYEEGSNKGYISADGTLTEWPIEARTEPVEFTGITEIGDPIDIEDYRGDVVVINFWYAGCPPCRAEAPDLQELNEKWAGQGVSFLGVNVRDQAGTALAFNDEYGITYPSIMDTNDGNASLAFAGQAAPNAVPTTIVLDATGRPASRILGQITSKSVLDTLIADTLEETAP
jgi:thiol-disulfide isomerase/thioredoxin